MSSEQQDNLLTEFPKQKKTKKSPKLTKKRIIEEDVEIENNEKNIQEDEDGYSTPKETISISTTNSNISSSTSSIDKKQKINNEFANCSVSHSLNDDFETNKTSTLDDLDAMFEAETNNDHNTITSNNSSKLTIIDIIRIYSTNAVYGNTLVGFTTSNMFGGRFYLNDAMNACSKLMYFTYITTLLNDPQFTKIKTDVAYLFHKNNRPINFVSYLPKVENKYFSEKIEETLKKLVSHFDGKHDSSNEGNVFKINFLSDFILDTAERRKPFIYLCKKMALPERLTATHQAVMDLAGELPTPN